MNIAWILERMQGSAARHAFIVDDTFITYAKLLDNIEAWQKKISEYGIQPGEIVALEGDYSPEICGAFVALIANDNIIVPLSQQVKQKRHELLGIAEVSKSLSFEGDQVLFESFDRPVKHALLQKLIAAGQPGLVLFTSGSTGAPKAILHDFSKLLEKYKTKRSILRSLSFLLFDHIGGVNTLFFTLSNGGTLICPKSRSPQDIGEAIDRYQAELLPTTPSFLNLLLMTEQYKLHDLSTLKIITYGTEVMPEHTLIRLRECLPHVELRQTYGMSELGILRAQSKDSESLWMRIGGEGIETRIIDNNLYIKSETAMEGYLNAPNPFDEEGWFNTEDQVMVDGEFIRIVGRRSEIINVGGLKVYPSEVEEVLLQIPEVQDVLVKGKINSLLGHVVTATVNVNKEMNAQELKEMIRSYCKDKLQGYQIPVYVYVQEAALFTDRFKKNRK